MNSHYDIIIIGVGSMGSAACYHLAKSGKRVLGLEQFDGPNKLASHGGQSRIIRKAYFEHPDYVPLLERGYDNWQALEDACNEKLYHQTGLLYAGAADSVVIKGIKESAKLYNIPLERLSNKEVNERYPAFSINPNYEVWLEPEAGFLQPEKAITLYIEESKRLGATIKVNTPVTGWSMKDEKLSVQTADQTYTCDKLVITAGAWTSKLVPALSAQLTVTRQLLGWFESIHPKHFELGSLPCWLIAEENNRGAYYGFPSLPEAFDGPRGAKIAYHFPGHVVDPTKIDRTHSKDDQSSTVDLIHKIFPQEFNTLTELKTCMYTNTPDENFVIDFLPDHDERVVIAAGFSGHGFKFASVVGEILHDLALYGKTKQPIGFLSVGRLKLQRD